MVSATPSLASPDRLRAVADRLGLASAVEVDAAGALVPDDEDERPTIVLCPGVGFHFGETLDAGPGTLHVTAKRVVWTSAAQPGLAFALRYPQIMMHAVSRDTSSFPKHCIYIQIDDGSEDMQQGGSGDDEEDGEQDADVPAEVRLVPEDTAKIDEIFKLLCEYAALNPDSDAEVEGEGDFFFDEDEVYAGLDEATRAQVIAQRMQGATLGDADAGEEGEEMEDMDTGRFEDAGEDVEGEGVEAMGVQGAVVYQREPPK